MLCFHASLIEIVPSVQITCVAGTLSFQLMPLDISFHCAIVPLKVMLVRPLQPEKAAQPMLVTLSGIVMLVKLLQL